MNQEDFQTPQRGRVRSLLKEDARLSAESPGRKIVIPSSPCLERLGYGTGVSVYLMERTPKQGSYRSPWAVKKVAKRFANKENQDFSGRLLREAETLRTLDHPNIIGYRTLTKAADGTLCLCLEKAEHCLMDLIEERLDAGAGPFTPREVGCVGLDIARALAYLHGEKLLMHGDLKSGNVLVFGDFKVAKLCDFGVALALEKANGNVKAGHHYIGTEAWSAPEIIDMDDGYSSPQEVAVTCKADVFSYGLTVWEMLSLCLPHADLLDNEDEDEDREEDDEEAYRTALGTRPALPELPTGVDYSAAITVFIATTEPEPGRRPTALDIINIWLED